MQKTKRELRSVGDRHVVLGIWHATRFCIFKHRVDNKRTPTTALIVEQACNPCTCLQMSPMRKLVRPRQMTVRLLLTPGVV